MKVGEEEDQAEEEEEEEEEEEDVLCPCANKNDAISLGLAFFAEVCVTSRPCSNISMLRAYGYY